MEDSRIRGHRANGSADGIQIAAHGIVGGDARLSMSNEERGKEQGAGREAIRSHVIEYAPDSDTSAPLTRGRFSSKLAEVRRTEPGGGDAERICQFALSIFPASRVILMESGFISP